MSNDVLEGTAPPVSGEQFELRHGDQTATIAGVGATLREYRAGGRDLVVPFAAEEMRPAYRGATIAPWPNRVVDGRFTCNGTEYQLPINEVERGHALHGLTPWLRFGAVERTESSVALRAVVEPQQGYPWRLLVETRFVLGERGLAQSVTATNLSDEPAPYGVCLHPYLTAGEGRVDDWALRSPGSRVLTVGEPRLVPEELVSVTVDPDRFDFREARRIGSVELDHAFTGFERDAAGEARVELRAADGRGTAVAWDGSCEWLQVHTADAPDASAPTHRIGLAVEPMTCAPDAFNGGEETGPARLTPGGSHTARWRIEPLG